MYFILQWRVNKRNQYIVFIFKQIFYKQTKNTFKSPIYVNPETVQVIQIK